MRLTRVVPILAVLCICVFGCYGISFRHDVALWRVAQRFEHLHHPAGSTLISETKNLGLLSGNGNHCDYLVAQLRTSGLKASEIASFYERQEKSNPAIIGEHPFLAFPSTGEWDDDLFIDDSNFRKAMDKAGKDAYVVFFLDNGDPGLDMRCS